MENNIASNDLLVDLVNRVPDNFTQVLRSKKNYHLYGKTFDYINTNYDGSKFSEKLYKHICGERHCKKCGTPLTSKQFRSFFDGYKEEFCSKKCALHSTERIIHIKQTKLDRYGSAAFNNLPKQQKTMVRKYGVPHNWSANSPLREKCYETNEKLHGSRTWNNQPKSHATKLGRGSYQKQIETTKNTCQKKYGVDFVTQLPEMRRKSKETNLRKYGVEYPSQNPTISEKCYKKWKSFILPSGRNIKLQGYEPIAILLLLQTYTEEALTTTRKDMPETWYILNQKRHRYFPDIFIKSENKFVEVKSEYTFQSKKEETIEKHNECLNNGYLHEIWIFNNKQKLMEVIKDYAS
jgi:hypothetical protein